MFFHWMMITILLGIFSMVLGAGVLLLIGCFIFENYESFKPFMIIGLILVFIGTVICAYPYAKIETMPYVQEEQPYVTHEIMALVDNNQINGKFYCRRGSIGEKLVYAYGYKTYTGGMKIQKVGEKAATVYFTDDVKPCAKWYRHNKAVWWVDSTIYSCDIYIPTGSLAVEYNIDFN